ncbi:MAG TPA: divergent PAP2 family protein [Candidatus Methylomirabilis sp.]|nr:divergent PAP2 family protein [Candidatus Methylomirabilis sp.]
MSYLILPLLAAVIAQASKLFIKSNHEKMGWQTIISYSGMPSGHAALVTALVTIIGLKQGILSPLFAIALVLAIIVIRDAVGIRRYLGEHGKMLNELIKDLKEEPDKPLDNNYPHLLERIGHTPAQAAVGALIGFLVSLIGFWVM